MNSTSELESSWTDFKKWWIGRQMPIRDAAPLTTYEHHPLISSAMNVSNCVIAVIDIKSMKYIYNSPNYAEFAGWDEKDIKEGGVQYAFSQIHPDDVPGVVQFSELINTYFQKLPNEEKGFYRSYWDFGVFTKEKKYLKVLQHDCAIKYDDEGKIDELLVFVSKVDGLIASDSQHLRITNGKESFFFKYEHKTKINLLLENLSPREMEVVRLIAKSMSMKEIAAHLGISFNTVKVHSAHMMRKLKARNSIEMINLLRLWGYI